jgi:hypothetical protein
VVETAGFMLTDHRAVTATFDDYPGTLDTSRAAFYLPADVPSVQRLPGRRRAHSSKGNGKKSQIATVLGKTCGCPLLTLPVD